MKNKKEKRINRIKKVIDKDFFANGERNEKSMRTMLVGIQTKNYKNNKVLDKETRRKLDIIMNDVYEKKLEVLNICKEIFYNDRQALINFASNYINIKENKLDLQLYIENDLTFNSPFICKECGKPEKVYFTVEEKKDKDGNLKYNKKTGEVEYKYSYCSACEDLKHTTKAVILEKKEIDENDEENNKKGKQTIFIITKFSEQTLWTNYISPIINTKNPQKKTLEKFKLDANYKNEHCDFKSKTIYGAENLRMPVHLSISGTVCSFLDKYYNIQTDIQKTISDNKKMENDIYAVLPKITKLPISVSTKQENDEYNKIVKSNNILINLYNQQQPNKESRLRQFKHLKGFPSFPIVEKQKQEVDYVELDNLLSPHLENAKLFWDTINIEQFQNAMAHFCGRIIYKLFKYYYKIDAIEPDSKNFKYILKDWKKADIKIIIERIDKKIKNIKEKLKQSDKRSEKALIEWYRGKSLIFFEYLRQNNDKTQFAKVRAEFDLKSSINAGFISKDNKERKVLEITGIAPKYKCALLIIDNQFVLAYNPYDQGKFIIKNNGKYEGYIKDTKTGLTAKNKLEIDENSTLFLPLAFGKRYGREYLYNIQNNFKNGGLTLNNARIIKDGEDYFVAITFTKLKGNKYKDIEYEHIIGVDRGEILPVAITITDLNGKIIENPELDICKNFSEKQKKIDKQKRKENRQKANYNEKLKKKAKNLSKATIEKIGAALLYYAIKYKALIIMEDLNREFGINPIMAVRQYSKIEDYLARKLKENGLMYGEVVKNTRNGLLGKVIAQHTSKTCSHCGSVFSSEKIRMLADKLYKKNDIWHVELEGKEISLNINYEKYVKSKGRYEQFNANTLIEELKQKDTKKNKELIETTLLNALNPRKTQAEFICPICGHKENADEQASLNIARRWIFEKEGEIKGDKGIKSSLEKEKYKENKISYWQAWEEFCKRKANEWNQRN